MEQIFTNMTNLTADFVTEADIIVDKLKDEYEAYRNGLGNPDFYGYPNDEDIDDGGTTVIDPKPF